MSVVKHHIFQLLANFQIFQIWDWSITSLGSRAQCGGGGGHENYGPLPLFGNFLLLPSVILSHLFILVFPKTSFYFFDDLPPENKRGCQFSPHKLCLFVAKSDRIVRSTPDMPNCCSESNIGFYFFIFQFAGTRYPCAGTRSQITGTRSPLCRNKISNIQKQDISLQEQDLQFAHYICHVAYFLYCIRHIAFETLNLPHCICHIEFSILHLSH